MKKLVKIKSEAVGIKSKFGFIIDECVDMALIKVSNKDDWNLCLCKEHCLILGNSLFETV